MSLRVVGNAEPAQLCPLLDVRIPLRQIVEFMDIQFIDDCGNDASRAVAHHIDDVLSQIISDILAGGIFLAPRSVRIIDQRMIECENFIAIRRVCAGDGQRFLNHGIFLSSY